MLGLAATGVATAELLAAEGDSVSVLEERPTDRTADQVAALSALGVETIVESDVERAMTALDGCDLVVPSPGVRPTHALLVAAAERSIPVRSEIDLAAERIAVPLVAITGTNGKTTTTELVTAMLRADGKRVACGGNIGNPLVTVCRDDVDVVVAEVSSFQLHFVSEAWRPAVAVLLNVADDHLDWHGSFSGYRADKARVFAHQRPHDVLVANADDPEVVGLAAGAPSRTEWVTTSGGPGWHVAGGSLVAADGTELLAVAALPRALPHDLTNSLSASAAARAVGAGLGAVQSTLRTYQTLPHRVQRIGETGGVTFYDDSKATNPHAAVRAVSAFDSVVLLAGGLNKGLDLGALRSVSDRIRAVVAFGDSAPEVVAAFDGHRPVERADSMRDAVRRAAHLAHDGDAVLLSPGCASFDMYPGGYTERGDDFAAEVRLLLEEGSR